MGLATKKVAGPMANPLRATDTDTMKLTYKKGNCTFTEPNGYIGFVPYSPENTPGGYAALRTLAVRYFAKARRKDRTILAIRAGHGLPLDKGTVWVRPSQGEVHVNYTWTASSGTEYIESHIFSMGD